MSTGTMIWLIAATGVGMWFWYDSMRARERAVGGARQLCAEQGLQFLDDTVALRRLSVSLDHRGPHWHRTYRFEYTTDGTDRHTGCIFVHGADPVRAGLEL